MVTQSVDEPSFCAEALELKLTRREQMIPIYECVTVGTAARVSGKAPFRSYEKSDSIVLICYLENTISSKVESSLKLCKKKFCEQTYPQFELLMHRLYTYRHIRITIS